MDNCQAGYKLEIYLEGELQNCEPDVIQKVIKNSLKQLNYKRVHVDCVDYDINEIENPFTVDCCENEDNLFENYRMDEVGIIEFGLTCKMCGNFIPHKE